MSDELKPCPFCGSKNVNDTEPPIENGEFTCRWVCPDCVCCGPYAYSVTGATLLWNNRHE